MKPATVHVGARSGSALVVTVVYLAVMTLFASTFLGYLNRTISNSGRAERKLVCIAIAEGGVDKALAELRVRANEYRGESNTTLGKGRFSVEVEPGPGAGEYTITSTASMLDGSEVMEQARIVAETVLTSSGLVHTLRWSEVKRW